MGSRSTLRKPSDEPGETGAEMINGTAPTVSEKSWQNHGFDCTPASIPPNLKVRCARTVSHKELDHHSVKP
jgi:hypothetical protein